MISESLCLRSFSSKKIYYTLHHPGSITLPGMYSCTNYNSLLGQCLRTFRILIFTSNGEIFTPIASKSSGQSTPVKEILSRCIFFNSCEVFLQVRVGVWKTMSKELLVIIKFKSSGESKCVEVTSIPLQT